MKLTFMAGDLVENQLLDALKRRKLCLPTKKPGVREPNLSL